MTVMTHDLPDRPRRGVSLSVKIGVGFGVVLLLHITVAIMGHLGLGRAMDNTRSLINAFFSAGRSPRRRDSSNASRVTIRACLYAA